MFLVYQSHCCGREREREREREKERKRERFDRIVAVCVLCIWFDLLYVIVSFHNRLIFVLISFAVFAIENLT